MFICNCKAVTDQDIKEAICEGAYTAKCLQDKLGVSTQCGMCSTDVQSLLDESLKPEAK